MNVYFYFFSFFLDKGEVFGWGNNEYSQMTLADGSQQVCTPRYIKMLSSLGKIKSVASAGSFCVALNGRIFHMYKPVIQLYFIFRKSIYSFK